MDYPTVGDKECGTMLAIVIFAVACVVIAFLALVSTVSAAPSHWLCEYTNALTNYPRVSLAQWDTEGYGWIDMPSDLGQDGFVFLPLSEEFTQGYHIEFSPSEQELWLWPFWSLDVRRDQFGDHEGNHDFCPVLVIDVGEG